MQTRRDVTTNERSHGKRTREVRAFSPSPRLTAVPPDHAERLRGAIAGLRGHREAPEAVDLTPKSAHEAITRQMVADLAADLAEVKTRVNAVLWLVAGAVIVDVTMRLAGVN